MEAIIQWTRTAINRHPVFTKSSALLAVLILVMAAYVLFCRPYQLQWGATAIEIARFMPGDEINPNPSFRATRAITIDIQGGRGRNGPFGPPPAQIPASGTTALGSYLR